MGSCCNACVNLSCAKVETLCANSLAEVGVAVGDFVEALEASRLSEDISTAVYQQLVALDDFVTFKKLMVRYRAPNVVGFPVFLVSLLGWTRRYTVTAMCVLGRFLHEHTTWVRVSILYAHYNYVLPQQHYYIDPRITTF